MKLSALEIKVNASHALELERLEALSIPVNMRYGTSVWLRLRAALAALKLISACECVAASCSGCPIHDSFKE